MPELEHKPKPGLSGAATAVTDLGQRVLLTPRILDQRAFEEYSGQLRALIDDLSRAVAESAQARADWQEASARQRTQLQLTAKLVQALNERSGEVRSLLAALDERAAGAQATPETTESTHEPVSPVVAADLAGLERRLMERIEWRVEDAERRIEERLERVSDIGGEASAVFEQAEKLARRLETRLDEARQLNETLRTVVSELRELVARADRVVSGAALVPQPPLAASAAGGPADDAVKRTRDEIRRELERLAKAIAKAARSDTAQSD